MADRPRRIKEGHYEDSFMWFYGEILAEAFRYLRGFAVREGLKDSAPGEKKRYCFTSCK